MSDKEFKPGNRKYIPAIGRRKTSTAQVRLYPKGSGIFMINGKSADDYFQDKMLISRAIESLTANNLADTYDVIVLASGGGKKGQSDAVRLGVARALVAEDEERRSLVKKAGFLRRDPRVKERKKYGLKRARRAPQWSKR